MKFFVQQQTRDIGVKVTGAIIRDVQNCENEAFWQWRNQAVQELISLYQNADLKSDPVLENYYTLHSRVQVPRRKNPPAPETLIKQLQKKGDIARVNPAVDIYNLISMKPKLALGAHDMEHFQGDITLKITDGSERFETLGSGENKEVNAGEYCYVDEADDVVCRLEIRQAEKDKVTELSHDIFYIIQGNEALEESLLYEIAEKLIVTTCGILGGTGEILKPEII